MKRVTTMRRILNDVIDCFNRAEIVHDFKILVWMVLLVLCPLLFLALFSLYLYFFVDMHRLNHLILKKMLYYFSEFTDKNDEKKNLVHIQMCQTGEKLTPVIIDATRFLQDALFGRSLSSFSLLYLWSSNLVLGVLLMATFLGVLGAQNCCLGILGFVFYARNKFVIWKKLDFVVFLFEQIMSSEKNEEKTETPSNEPNSPKSAKSTKSTKSIRPRKSSKSIKNYDDPDKAQNTNKSSKTQSSLYLPFWIEEPMRKFLRRSSKFLKQGKHVILYGKSRNSQTSKKTIFIFENERFYLTTWSKPIGLDWKRYTDSLNREIQDLT